MFSNGWGASVLNESWMYRDNMKTYEIALIRKTGPEDIDWNLYEDHPRFPDSPYAGQDYLDVVDKLRAIESLPNPTPLLSKIGFY